MTEREKALIAAALTAAATGHQGAAVAAELLGLRRRIIRAMNHEAGEMPRAIADLAPKPCDYCRNRETGAPRGTACPTCGNCDYCRAN